jgi:hypothetical protein
MFVSQIFDEVAEILATTDESKIFRKLTQAVQALMESGHYFHTQQEVDVCTGWDGCTITLPRGIEVPLGVNVDGSPTYFRNRLFQYHVNKGGMYNNVGWAWDDRGFVSTMMDIRQPSQLVAVAEHSDDAGLQIRVVGTDSLNRELRSQTTDGIGVDGVYIPINAQSDFPLGTIAPPGVTLESRSASVTPLGELISAAAHQLVSGQGVVLSVPTGSTPEFLVDGQKYYVGVDSENSVRLYSNSIEAKAGVNPVQLQSIIGSGTLRLTDARESNLLTTVQLVPDAGVIPVAIDSANEVSFWKNTDSGSGFSGELPSPLQEGTTYFANQKDEFDLQIFNNLQDAQSGKNPIPMTGSSGKFDTDIKKPIFAQTTVEFPVAHYYQQGDQVQAYTSGGVLPSPLLEGQNYFVNVIDGNTISLHLTAADAAASTSGILKNPITFTDSGAGTNSLVKLIPATASTGTTSQINASGISFETIEPEFTAIAQPVVVGSVTSISITVAGSKYTTAPAVVFDPPPPPPEGSNQIVITATGYAVMELDAVGSTTFKVGSIVITNPGSGYTSSPAVSIDPPPDGSGGTTASATAVITTSSISYFNITSSGAGYAAAPKVTISGGGGNGATASASIDASGRVTSVNVVAQGTGYASASGITVSFTPSSGVFIQFSSTGLLPAPLSSGAAYRAENRSADGTFTVVNADFSPINVTDSGTGNVSVVLSRSFFVGLNARWNGDFSGISNGNKMYLSSDYILPTGTSANVPYYVRKIGSDNLTCEFYASESAANAASVTATPTIDYRSSSAATMTIGYKTSRVVTMAVSGTTVTLTAVTPNTFDTSDFRAGSYIFVEASGSSTNTEGVFIVASVTATKLVYKTTATAVVSTGTITVYGGGSIATLVGTFDTSFFKSGVLMNVSSNQIQTNAALGLFEILSAAPTQVTYSVQFGTTVPTGSLTASSGGQVCKLSGTFNTSLYAAGDTVLVSSSISQINSALGFFALIAATSGLITYAVPIGTEAPTGTIQVRSRIIRPTALGVGQSYSAVRIPSYARAFNNLISVDSLEYLQDGIKASFSSTGSLPFPLNSITLYTIILSEGSIYLLDPVTGVQLEFNQSGYPTLAVGRLSMNIVRDFTAVSATTITSSGNVYETGNQVTVRPVVGDSLPASLDESQPGDPNYYYVRRVSSGLFELYDTAAHAKAYPATTGRVTYQNTGDSVLSTFFVDGILPPTLVKTILHVEKPVTKGYVSLYAYDYGRSNDMCLIGQYHPSEVNPKYRRIRIGKPCAWARIIYRVKAPAITSVYDYVPIENERALIAAVHAIDLEDKDFIDQSQKYFALAFAYLKNQSESMDGHAMAAPQINNITFGDGTDPVMF